MNWPEAIFLIFTVPAFCFTGLVILAMFLDALEALCRHVQDELFWSGFMRDIKKLREDYEKEAPKGRRR